MFLGQGINGFTFYINNALINHANAKNWPGTSIPKD